MWSGHAGATPGEAAATAGEDEAPAALPGPSPGAAAGQSSANPQPAAQQQWQQQPLPLAQRSSRDPRLQAHRHSQPGASGAATSPGSAVPAATAAAAQPSPGSPSMAATAGGSALMAAGSWLGLHEQRQAEQQQGAGAGDSQQEEGTEGDPQQQQRQCSHCSSTTTGGKRWRWHPTTRAPLCHACWQYVHNHASQLPARRALERRERNRQALPPAERRCLQCGSARPGPSSHARPRWFRHPATGEEWLCQPCCNKAYETVRRQRRQRAACGDPSGSSSDSEEGEQEQAASRPWHPTGSCQWAVLQQRRAPSPLLGARLLLQGSALRRSGPAIRTRAMG